jgi:citrate synthase
MEVLEMMHKIGERISWPYGDKQEQIIDYLCSVMDGDVIPGNKIPGLGHVVYKITDPRAIMIREDAKKLEEAAGGEVLHKFELYDAVASLANKAICKHEKAEVPPLVVNVDFYSGFVEHEILRIPKIACTGVFGTSRAVGLLAHIVENLVNGIPLTRPESFCPLSEIAVPYS